MTLHQDPVLMLFTRDAITQGCQYVRVMVYVDKEKAQCHVNS